MNKNAIFDGSYGYEGSDHRKKKLPKKINPVTGFFLHSSLPPYLLEQHETKEMGG